VQVTHHALRSQVAFPIQPAGGWFSARSETESNNVAALTSKASFQLITNIMTVPPIIRIATPSKLPKLFRINQPMSPVLLTIRSIKSPAEASR
jgi:hypothetical protein